MAASYAQSYARATAPAFLARVRMALAKVAGDAVGEPILTMGEVIHTKRHNHGHNVLHALDRDEMVRRYAFAVVMEPQLVAIDEVAGATGVEVPDTTLFIAVRGAFPRFAGVKATDTPVVP